jgi:hypothetical protein
MRVKGAGRFIDWRTFMVYSQCRRGAPVDVVAPSGRTSVAVNDSRVL